MAWLLLVCGWIAPGQAQPLDSLRWSALTEPVFHPLDSTGGSDIPANSGAMAMAQDGLGFLWMTSYNGLSRWDGYQLRTYRLAPGQINSLPQSYVQALAVDHEGQLWIGATAGALARYDRQRDQFVPVPLVLDGKAPSQASINRIVGDGGTGLWLATDEGLVHVDPDTGKARLEFPTTSPAVAVFVGRDGGLWLSTRGGLLRRPADAARFEPVSLPMRQERRATVISLMQDRSGRLWVGTDGAGAFVSSRQQDRFARVNGPDGRAPDVVPTLIEVRPGVVWLGTDTHGILQASAEAPHLRYIEHNPMLATSLGEGSVFSLLRDHSGMLWVGTDRAVARMDTNGAAFQTLFGVAGSDHGLGASDASALAQDDRSRIWIGTSDAGVLIVDPDSGASQRIVPDPDAPERALPGKFVTAFARAPDGGMFIGTTQGLYRADAQGRGVQRVTVPGRSVIARINRLFRDADGVVWVGGNDGLQALPNPDRLHPHPDPHNPDLADQRIAMLAQRDADSLWVGTNNGLAWLDLRSGHMTSVAQSNSAMGMVTSLLKDGPDRLWLGTLGHGLHVLDRQGEQWVTRAIIDGQRGLPNNNINMILRADDGALWVSTDDGLARVDPTQMQAQAFGTTDGVPISTYWTHSGLTPNRDELLFGGLGGITIIRPSLVKPWSYQPQVVITDLRVGSEPQWVSPDAGTVPVSVPAEDNSLSVSFAALDLSVPQQNRYAYQLEGFDKKWTQVTASSRHASYTNLPPGHYVLRVRGSNHTGRFSPHQIALQVDVQPRWYQTTLARAAQWLLAGLLVLAILQWRTVRLRQQTARLERLVEQRTVELRASRQHMQHLAYVDSLTGLPNRREFNERMATLTARGAPAAFALLLIDLDHFKSVNDTLGHDAGDALLKTVADRIAGILRDGDALVRLGGDEFALVLDPAPASTAAIDALCARIVAAVARPMTHQGQEMLTSASIGVACFPADGLTSDTLYKAADTALYAAKDGGRGTWRFASN
ncbi:diguanylate cyclase (GGDEF) domain-containing protein [Pseudoxanthomonas sp. GM95]|uniref:ligand-binding sensor domain-containing diguanylate cyclase n=1 Tax=Pseudoxanthomonas sp. GM95 TaxID=1881043 RepID=UPI0008AEF34B|nr:ligand-binding sensor domain-containing diguanylate cyclase [Pseudoxanthomonas sp. GM95]SEM40401.1 diguanylate cyclase (GGDEF) domain-containing protein [Pseudoxanthomonas sp. GM95]